MTLLSAFHSFILPVRSSNLDVKRSAVGTEEKVNSLGEVFAEKLQRKVTLPMSLEG